MIHRKLCLESILSTLKPHFILLFNSSHFSFLVFGHFWQQSYQNTKILHNLCLHFARQDGQDGKNRKENHATKVTKIPKTNRQVWDEQNKSAC